MAEPVLDLNAANAKQKLKIYKGVAKEIKSKEIEIKLEAVKKCKDARYFAEGNCFTPFLDAITVKKKSIDFSHTALEFLNAFIDNTDVAQGGTGNLLAALKTVYDREGGSDLLPMASVVEAMIYKEEVKKVKVKSPVKGQPPIIPEDPPERDVIINIRTLALQALHGICVPITNPTVAPDVPKEYLCKAVASIPNIESNLIWVLNSLVTRYQQQTPATIDSVLRDGCRALTIACVIFKYSDANVTNAMDRKLIPILNSLSVEKSFSALIGQCYEILARHTAGILALTSATPLSAMVNALDSCAEVLNAANIAAANTAPAGKDGKKGAAPAPAAEKGGKGGKVGKEVSNALDGGNAPVKFLQEDVNRLMLIAMKTLSISISLVAQNYYCSYCRKYMIESCGGYGPGIDTTAESCEITEDMARMAAGAIGKVIANPLVWSTIKSPAQSASSATYSVEDILTCATKCITDLAVLGTNFRVVIATSPGLINNLLSLFNQSASVIVEEDSQPAGVTATEGDSTAAVSANSTANKLMEFRLVLERALLCLLTDFAGNLQSNNSADNAMEVLDTNDISNSNIDSEDITSAAKHNFNYIYSPPSLRWQSCKDYITDTSLFPSAPIPLPSESQAPGKGKGKDAKDAAADANALVDRGPMPHILALILSTEESFSNGAGSCVGGLSNHGARLLCALMNGISFGDGSGSKMNSARVRFAINNSLDAAVVTKLVKVLQAKLVLLLEEVRLLKESSLNDIGGTGDAAAVVVTAADASSAAVPTTAAAVYSLFSILEVLVLLSPEAVNAFAGASKEFVCLCAQCLYCCGPVSSALIDYGNYNQFGSDAPIEQQRQGNEFECKLFDLRRVFWGSYTVSMEDPLSSVLVSSALLRPLIFDVLSIIARAYRQYSTFENGAVVPVATPLTALPAIQSPCREASMLVCKYLVDVCVSILLIKTQFGLSTASAPTVIALPNRRTIASEIVNVDTQTSALALLAHMTCNGTDSIYGMLEGIAEAGYGNSNTTDNIKPKNASIVALQNFLIDKIVSSGNTINKATVAEADSSAAVNGISDSLNDLRIEGHSPTKPVGGNGSKSAIDVVLEDFTWTRAQFFEQVLPNATSDWLSVEQLVTQKQLWPYLCLCSSLIGTISNPDEPAPSSSSSTTTATLALKILQQITAVYTHNSTSQPLCCDVAALVFVGLGGCIGLAGCLGVFGRYSNSSASAVLQYHKYNDLLGYLTSRGRVREEYWKAYVAAEAAKVEIDPKTGKPVVAKGGKDAKGKDAAKAKDKASASAADKKKGGKDAKDGASAVSCVAEVVYNDDVVVDEANCDPNHGPNAEVFRRLLQQVQVDEYHTNSICGSLLTIVLQSVLPQEQETQLLSTSALPELLSSLIASGANVNAVDAQGRSPLMYAILLHSNSNAIVGTDEVDNVSPVVGVLLDNRSNIDAVDREGNSVLKYVSVALSIADIASLLSSKGHTTASSQTSYDVFGYPSVPLVKRLLGLTAAAAAAAAAAGSVVDMNICDEEGNGPLHWFVGTGSLSASIGGYTCHIVNATYNNNNNNNISKDLSTALAIVSDILHVNPLIINNCNRLGVVPLHIAAARGCLSLTNLLLSPSATSTTSALLRNPKDALGFLPIHYVASVCPIGNSIEMFELLIAQSVNQPITEMQFDINKYSKNSSESKSDAAVSKELLDCELLTESILNEILNPSAIKAKRLDRLELLQTKTNCNTNILQLIMCAHSLATAAKETVLVYPNIAPFVILQRDNREERIRLVQHAIAALTTNPQLLQQQLITQSIVPPASFPSPLAHTYLRSTLTPCAPSSSSSSSSSSSNNNVLQQMICNVNDYQLTFLHAIAKLFTDGNCPLRELSAAELRSKRVKSYGSVELQLLDLLNVFGSPSDLAEGSLSGRCSLPVQSNVLQENDCSVFDCFIKGHDSFSSSKRRMWTWQWGWTALEAALHNSNAQLVNYLLAAPSYGAAVSAQRQLIHLLAANTTSTAVSFDMANQIISLCAQQPDYQAYLNSPLDISALQLSSSEWETLQRSRPIHIAIRTANLPVLKALLLCPKCDINCKDERTGWTPIFEACQQGPNALRILEVFAECASDRVDFLIPCRSSSTSDVAAEEGEAPAQCTCVEAVLQLSREELLSVLINMRRNDVIEVVVSTSSATPLLERLEQENMQLAQICGYSDPDQAALATEADGAAIVGGDSVPMDVVTASINEAMAVSVSDIQFNNTFSGTMTIDTTTASNADTTTEQPSPTQRIAVQRIIPLAESPVRRPTPPTTQQLQRLAKTNVLLGCLLRAVLDAGFDREENHLHICYSQGKTFPEYCGVSAFDV